VSYNEEKHNLQPGGQPLKQNNNAIKKLNLFNYICKNNPDLAKTKKQLKIILVSSIILYALLIVTEIIFYGFEARTFLKSFLNLCVISLFSIGIMNGLRVFALLLSISSLRSLLSLVISIFKFDSIHSSHIIYLLLFGLIHIILLVLYLYIVFSPKMQDYELALRSITYTDTHQ